MKRKHDWPRLSTTAWARLRQRGWNKRVLTFDDFEELCHAENILVIVAALPHDLGTYSLANDRPLIKLDSKLREPLRTLVALHEYGHHCWHVPGHFGLQTKTETEADFIAFAGLIPVRLLNQYEDWEIAEEYGYPLAFVRERCRLWRIYHH